MPFTPAMATGFVGPALLIPPAASGPKIGQALASYNVAAIHDRPSHQD